ncbi:Qc-SNARE, USE1 family [Volvox carteri f. nagariensis]|uniref:Qc-SNARE, USE1 family n=1 Tax=Volvox carteri f. nagariensis TaxID=3068 RepID=D8TH02_VOLCA|nr:Qc-SNARE, USE1 family [Volvox carteri f. nagariensis]EFJ52625.1 Qc-SNARE, USE1 family [Volvox carteri f. nagariensis]|eukprot:XP_002945630.1 Qc-SNARE, USE1 family [Volvox carteri f. nagariensis]
MAVTRTAQPGTRLPTPKGSQLEVSFRRLLESCLKHLKTLDASAATAAVAAASGSSGASALADGLNGRGAVAAATGAAGTSSASSGDSVSGGGGGDVDIAARVLKMRHYVDTLRELLADLRAQQDALGLDAATLDLYDTHLKAVAAAVPKVQLPPYCQNLITGTAIAAGGGSSSSASHSAPPLSYFTLPAARPGMATPAGGGGGAGGGGRVGTSGRTATADVAGLSSAASERLRGAEAAQALLTDELVELTAALKANAMGMAGAVAERGKLLDVTDAALTDSLVAAKLNAAEAGRQVKRSGGTLCFTCMIMLVVGMVFTAMVVYIKFTHLVGYRAAPAGAPPAGWMSWWGSFLGGAGGAAGAGAGGTYGTVAGDDLRGLDWDQAQGGAAGPWHEHDGEL